MSLAKKLNLKDGIAVQVIGHPSGVDLDDVAVSTAADAPGLLLFVRRKRGIQGVRMISIDDTWSAMRFRPRP
jgi:hypothetical protein